METIGERLKYFRKKKDMTQGELAVALGVTAGFISKIESGFQEPSEPIIKLLENLYGLNRKWLLTGSGEMYQEDVKKNKSMSDLIEKLENTDRAIRELLNNLKILPEGDGKLYIAETQLQKEFLLNLKQLREDNIVKRVIEGALRGLLSEKKLSYIEISVDELKRRKEKEKKL